MTPFPQISVDFTFAFKSAALVLASSSNVRGCKQRGRWLSQYMAYLKLGFALDL